MLHVRSLFGLPFCSYFMIIIKAYLVLCIFAVLAMFFGSMVWLFLCCEMCEIFCHFVLLYKYNATSSPELLGGHPFLGINLAPMLKGMKQKR